MIKREIPDYERSYNNSKELSDAIHKFTDKLLKLVTRHSEELTYSEMVVFGLASMMVYFGGRVEINGSSLIKHLHLAIEDETSLGWTDEFTDWFQQGVPTVDVNFMSEYYEGEVWRDDDE